ncbi:MAG: metal-dependent transcriptional regulator [Egibacteraceae bacterium]
MTPLIDATEMYLRTLYELEEEGITPIRARLVERLGLSAPAVSETVTRLEQEGMLHVKDDRTLALTQAGHRLAVAVMRKHRLAERLLTDVIGLSWEQVHTEACRWEHVISDAVEDRLVAILHAPERDPHGNPIPGVAPPEAAVAVRSLAAAGREGLRAQRGDAGAGVSAVIERISERLQADPEMMRFLVAHGLKPGSEVTVTAKGEELALGGGHAPVLVPPMVAEHLYVAV